VFCDKWVVILIIYLKAFYRPTIFLFRRFDKDTDFAVDAPIELGFLAWGFTWCACLRPIDCFMEIWNMCDPYDRHCKTLPWDLVATSAFVNGCNSDSICTWLFSLRISNNSRYSRRIPPHRYGKSHAVWNHSVTCHPPEVICHSRPTPEREICLPSTQQNKRLTIKIVQWQKRLATCNTVNTIANMHHETKK